MITVYDTYPLVLAGAIAAQAHHRQKDKAGDPYLGHVLRVSCAGNNVRQQILGALHDVIEDTEVTLDDLRGGFAPDIVAGVDLLTRQKEQSYDEYLDRLLAGGDHDVIQVKLFDLADNLIRARIPHPTLHDHERWAKYRAARKRLQMALQSP